MRLLAVAVLVALAVPPVALARKPKVDGILCVGQGAGSLLNATPERRESLLATLADLGWTTLRVDFRWAAAEPSRGDDQLALYDDLVARAQANGVRLIGVLTYGAPWAAAASGGDEFYPPDDPADFARFAAAAARRFKGRVAAWEIWDAPNASGLTWKPVADAARYAVLAQAAAKAIRKVDRKVTVVTGGLASFEDLATYGSEWAFFAAAKKARASFLNPFKAAGLQPYTYLASAPEVDANGTVSSVDHLIDAFRLRLVRAKAKRLAPWATAIGWPTSTTAPGISEEDQARYLVRAATIALSDQIEKFCWTALSDDEGAATIPEASFGLIRPGTTLPLDPKPAYTAAKVFAQLLAGARFVDDLRGRLELDNDAFAFSFQGVKQGIVTTVVVAWATHDGVDVHIPIDALSPNKIQVVSMLGDVTEKPKDALVAPLTLGPSPVYVITKANL